jgi:hypothetical protein
MIPLHLIFEGLPNCFQKWLHHFTNPPIVFENSIFSTSCQHLLLSLLIIAILVGMKWYLNVVLICVSVMTNNVQNLFTYLLTVYLLWQNIHSYALMILVDLSCYYWAVRGFFICIFWIEVLWQIIICEYFLAYCRLSFHFLDSIHWSTSF